MHEPPFIDNFFILMDVQLAPCALLAVIIHPGTTHHIVNRVLWAFCVYLEAVSVMPQLRVMQNTRVCLNSVLFEFVKERLLLDVLVGQLGT